MTYNVSKCPSDIFTVCRSDSFLVSECIYVGTNETAEAAAAKCQWGQLSEYGQCSLG